MSDCLRAQQESDKRLLDERSRLLTDAEIVADDPYRYREILEARLEREKKKRVEVKAAVKDDQSARYVADLERVKAAHVEPSVFGVPLGKPIKLPRCNTDFRDSRFKMDVEICLRYKESGEPLAIYVPYKLAPDWFDGVVLVDVQQGVFVSGTMEATETRSMVTELVKKFGKVKPRVVPFSNAFGKTSEAAAMEWKIPGLIVKYEPTVVEQDGTIKGTLTIELETVARAREDRQQESESKKVKL